MRFKALQLIFDLYYGWILRFFPDASFPHVRVTFRCKREPAQGHSQEEPQGFHETPFLAAKERKRRAYITPWGRAVFPPDG